MADKTKRSTSKRQFIDDAGDQIEKIEDASGARYTLLDPQGNVEFDYSYGENENADRMFAIFGFHTKLGNEVSSVLNDKNNPGTFAEAAEACNAFLQAIQAGQWGVPGERVGARLDPDILAEAVVRRYADVGKTVDKAAVRARCEDAEFTRSARADAVVMAHYRQLKGTGGKSLDDLLNLGEDADAA